MCEINPKHKKVYRLEVFTSIPMSEEEFTSMISYILLGMEMKLNESSLFRFHIHETEDE